MKFLRSSDTVKIHNENRSNIYNFSVSDIMSYISSLGYNSFVLDPYYSDGGYYIRAFNIITSDNCIYFIDFDPSSSRNKFGYYGNSDGYNRYIVAQSSNQLGIYSGLSITWSQYAYQDNKIYYTFENTIADMHDLECAVYTTISYNKIYLNNSEFTPSYYDYTLYKVYTYQDGTGTRSCLNANHIPVLHSQTLVAPSSRQQDIKGYNSAVCFIPGSGGRVEIFAIFDSGDEMEQYNNGVTTYPTPYDNGNNLYGYYFNSTGGQYWNYIEVIDNLPVYNNYQDWYNYVTQVPTPSSNWVSVQSLTGQGITIQLSTSTDTNNGEAITTSDTTKFALTAESNINKLIVDRLARGN